MSLKYSLLNINRADLFKGVIEEDGEDQVMLEGFLESVKALTDVNLESPGHSGSTNIIPRYEENLATEANARYLQDHQKDDESIQNNNDQEKNANTQDNTEERKKPGFLRSFSKKIKRFD